MAEDLVYFNGINGATGRYLVPPVPLTALAEAVRQEPPRSPEEAGLVKRVSQQLRGPYLALPFDIDPNKLAEAGWGVVFAQGAPAELRAALQPLIDHRNELVSPDRRKVLEYRPGESMRDWLKRYGANPGTINPTKVPYYLLLVGDPASIPFDFQYLLDIEYAVGRLAFDRPEQYEQYARSVIAYETSRAVPNARKVVYWATRHNDRDATQMSADWLATPLYQGVPAEGDQAVERAVTEVLSYEARLLKGREATKANLLEELQGRGPGGRPALLFTASHGLGWPRSHPAHKTAQGALLCQGFPVGDPLAGTPLEDDYLAAADVTPDTRLEGLVAFFFACFGAGTPEFNNFVYEGDRDLNFLFDRSQRPERLAERAFVSPLPQQLLSHPQGGALAVIGHVDRAWGYSIRPLGADFRPVDNIGPQLAPYRNCLGRILKGEPVGHATKDIHDKFAILAADLLSRLDRGSNQPLPPDAALAWSWVERNDARNYILLGDPAVRLRVDRLAKPEARPPVFAALPAAAAQPARAPGIDFEVPAGYSDQTNYTFQDATSGRRLTVVPAAGLRTDDDLRTAAQDYLARAEDLCDAQDATVSEVQKHENGSSVVTLVYTFDDRPGGPDKGGSYRERSAFVRFGDKEAVHLSYVSPKDDARAEPEFRRLVGSLRPVGPPPAAAPVTFHVPVNPVAATVRRQVGQVQLDLDASLVGPSSYQFVSGDSAVRLELALEPSSQPPAFAAVAGEADTGGFFERVAQTPGDLSGPVRFEPVPDPWAAPAQEMLPTFAAPAAAPAEGLPAPREVGGVRVRLSVYSAPQEAARAGKDLQELNKSLRPGG